MSWSGGVYTRGYASWSNDASLNLPISATKFDTEDNDFAAGLNNCLTKDGLNTPNAAMTWGLSAAQVLALTRGNDGTVFSTARTGGTNNPALTAGVVDATGVNLNLSAGTTLGLQVAGTNVIAIAAGAITLSQPALEINGTAAAPGFAFTSATGTGLYRFAANSLGFAANGAAAGSIASTGAWSLPAATAAVTLNIAGAANQYTSIITGNSTSGQSLGLEILAGTTSADFALTINNQASSHGLMQIAGDGSGVLGYNGSSLNTLVWGSTGQLTLNVNATTGFLTVHDANGAADRGYLGYGSGVITGMAQADLGLRGQGNLWLSAQGATAIMKLLGTSAPTIQGYGPTAAALVDMTPDTGTFTGAITGCTAGVAPACKWVRNGNQVKLTIGAATGTSNASTMTMTGLPAAIQPATTQLLQCPDGSMEDNSAVLLSGCAAQVTASSGTVTFWKGGGPSGFTNVNTKGVNAAFTICYHLF